MILCGNKVEVGGGQDGAGVGCPPRKYTGRKDKVAGRVKEVSYVTISDEA